MKALLCALALLVGAFASTNALAQPQTPTDPAVLNRPPAERIRPVKIILVGDSTTAVYGGWGPSFCAHHVMQAVACLNLARGGRSTYSYRAEGSWDVALSEMRTRGYDEIYVLIQFGHNDQPGRPGRSTDLATEFPANLQRYVRETRSAGAIPVLLTPLTRRQFENGQLKRDLDDWAAAVRRVAAEMNVPLVDLNAESSAAVQALGPALAAQFAPVAPNRDISAALLTGTTKDVGPTPPAPPDPAPVDGVAAPGAARIYFDYTHLGDAGAGFFSAMVTRDLMRAVPALRDKLIL